MAYEFNNDDHFDMKSQMMVGKIGENLFLKIYGNSPQCEIDDLRDDAVFQDKDVDFRVRQVKNSEGNPQFVKEYSPKSLRNREGFWYNRRKPPREAPSWKSTPKTPAAKQWLLT